MNKVKVATKVPCYSFPDDQSHRRNVYEIDTYLAGLNAKPVKALAAFWKGRWYIVKEHAEVSDHYRVLARLSETLDKIDGPFSDVSEPQKPKKPTISEWKLQVANEYDTWICRVVPRNSLNDRNMDGRFEKLAVTQSPYGGWYVVYSKNSLVTLLFQYRRQMRALKHRITMAEELLGPFDKDK